LEDSEDETKALSIARVVPSMRPRVMEAKKL
jgi:hypothetical protein